MKEVDVKKKLYIAPGGKAFLDKNDCQKYEIELSFKKNIIYRQSDFPENHKCHKMLRLINKIFEFSDISEGQVAFICQLSDDMIQGIKDGTTPWDIIEEKFCSDIFYSPSSENIRKAKEKLGHYKQYLLDGEKFIFLVRPIPGGTEIDFFSEASEKDFVSHLENYIRKIKDDFDLYMDKIVEEARHV